MSENNTALCYECLNAFPADDLTAVVIGSGEQHVCPDCLARMYSRCEACGEYRHNYDMWLRNYHNSHSICHRCSPAYTTCAHCGELLLREEALAEGHVVDGLFYCSDECWNHRPVIKSYGYKPEPIFRRRNGESDDVLTFGVELEVDCGGESDDTAREIVDSSDGRVYCKHDGSLDDGFEIVSHPGSLAHHMYELRWKNICRICKRDGYESHDAGTCGLHIHVGRRQLGAQGDQEGATARTVILAQVLERDLITFSRRTSAQLNDWARFPELNLAFGREYPRDLEYDASHTYRDGRYQAVNLTNTSTIEFRIFRGTLNRDTIIASLQLVNNLCRYAMEHTTPECLSATFADIVNLDPRDELVEYCASHGLYALAECPA